MGFFSLKTSKPEAKTKVKSDQAVPLEEILTPESQHKVSAEKAVASAAIKGQAGMSYRLLHSPRVSEKSAILASCNVYVLHVPVEAEKVGIAKAVKSLYGVTVEKVRTARGIGKRLTRGRRTGQRKRWKKAFVTIKQGQKIDLYEGV